MNTGDYCSHDLDRHANGHASCYREGLDGRTFKYRDAISCPVDYVMDVLSLVPKIYTDRVCTYTPSVPDSFYRTKILWWIPSEHMKGWRQSPSAHHQSRPSFMFIRSANFRLDPQRRSNRTTRPMRSSARALSPAACCRRSSWNSSSRVALLACFESDD